MLALLCDLGGNSGIGFDPAYIPECTPSNCADRIQFIPDFYTDKASALQADFLRCKMTLEHIPDTAAFMGMVCRSLRDPPNRRGETLASSDSGILRNLHVP